MKMEKEKTEKETNVIDNSDEISARDRSIRLVIKVMKLQKVMDL